MKYLKLDFNQLKIFIESQFTTSMCWDTRALEWELDHVLPISKFDLTNQQHKEVCFIWSNLKPIPKSLNKQKFNKCLEDTIDNHARFCKEYAIKHKLPYIDIYAFYKNNLNQFN
jgi:hypothetical protein